MINNILSLKLEKSSTFFENIVKYRLYILFYKLFILYDRKFFALIQIKNIKY